MGTSREDIVNRLRVLESRGGKLTPSRVLEDARDPESPLHHWEGWTWDTDEAAAANLISEARTLLAVFTYPVESKDSKTVKVHLYVRDPAKGPKEQGYIRTEVLAKDRDKSRVALQQDLNRALGHHERVRTLAVGLDLEEEVKAVTDSLALLRRLVI